AMDPRSFVLFPEVKEVLGALRRAGVELGIVSNSFPSAERILQHLKLMRYFSRIIWSHRCGYAKPEKEIFDAAFRCVRGTQTQVLFIDDRPEFVKKAMQAGVELALWINRNGYEDGGVKQIRSLWDIVHPMITRP
ncbi:MAG: HAD family hydrolase, partial [Anaerolineae bacterium]